MVLPSIKMTLGCPASLRDCLCLEMMQRPSWKGIGLLRFLAWWPISLFRGGSTWWGIDERERRRRMRRGRRRDTWDVFAVQQNSSQWGQTVSALLIASPCQTIFKRNLLMQCGPAYFCFYFFSCDSCGFFGGGGGFPPMSSSFHVLAPCRRPPTRVSSPASVGGRYPVLPLHGKLFQEAPVLNGICLGS